MMSCHRRNSHRRGVIKITLSTSHSNPRPLRLLDVIFSSLTLITLFVGDSDIVAVGDVAVVFVDSTVVGVGECGGGLDVRRQRRQSARSRYEVAEIVMA